MQFQFPFSNLYSASPKSDIAADQFIKKVEDYLVLQVIGPVGQSELFGGVGPDDVACVVVGVIV